MNVNFTTTDKSNETIIILTTSEVFFFICQQIIFENILIWGKDMDLEIQNCLIYSSNQNFGFLNLEYFPSAKAKPILRILNCSFINFNPLSNFGFTSFILFYTRFGDLFIESTNFSSSFLPFGLIFFPKFSFIIQNDDVYNTIEFIHFFLKDYKIYNRFFSGANNCSLINVYNFVGILNISNCNFTKMQLNNGFLQVLNDESFLAFLLIIETANVSNQSYHNYGNIIISAVEISNSSFYGNLFQVLHVFGGFWNLRIKNSDMKSFMISNQSKLFFSNIILDSCSFDLFIEFYFTNFRIKSSIFENLSFNNVFFKTSNCENMKIQSSTFSKIYGMSSFFLCDSFYEINLQNNSFTKINSNYFFYLTNCEKTTNKNNIFSRNNLTFIWPDINTCHLTLVEGSEFYQNNFYTNIFCNFYFYDHLIIFRDSKVYDNLFFSSLLFRLYSGVCIFEHFFLINNSFVTLDIYYGLMDFEEESQVFILNSLFQNNGLIYNIERQDMYYSTINAFMIWMLFIKNSSFISESKVEIDSGFISGWPVGNCVQLINNKFIISEFLPDCLYMGMSLNEVENVLMKNNVFMNFVGNNFDFTFLLGSIFLYSGKDPQDPKNLFTAIFENNFFYNCSCIKRGAITISNYRNVRFFNDTFFNSSSVYGSGGHLSILHVFNSILRNITCNMSFGTNGGAVYLKDLTFCKIENLNIFRSVSINIGNIFISAVSTIIITKIISSDTFTTNDGGLFYIQNSNIILNNSNILRSKSGRDGGCIFLSINTQILVFNSNFVNLEANSGAFLSADEITNIIIKNCSFSFSIAKDNGGVFLLKGLDTFVVYNVTLQNCQSFNGIISLDNELFTSSLILENIKCINNNALFGSFIFFATFSKIVLNNIQISNCSNNVLYISSFFPLEIQIHNIIIDQILSNTLSALYFESTILSLKNLSFSNCVTNFPIFFFKSSNIAGINWYFYNISKSNLISLRNCSFIVSNITVDFLEIIYSSSFLACFKSKIKINRGGFFSLRSSDDKNIEMSESSIKVFNCTFYLTKGTIFKGETSNMTITITNFFNNTSFDQNLPNEIYFSNEFSKNFQISILKTNFSIHSGLALFLKNINNVVVFKSCFSSLSPRNIRKSSIVADFIQNINFISSSFHSLIGRAITIQMYNSSFLTKSFFYNCFFSKNQAILGNSLYLVGNLHIKIVNTCFYSNVAFTKSNMQTSHILEGAATIFFNLYENGKIYLENNVFEKNTADFIIPNILSSLPFTLDKNNTYLECTDQKNFTRNNLIFPLHLKSIDFNEEFVGIGSGQGINLKIEIVDYLNQTIIFDNFSLLSLKSDIKTTSQNMKKIINSRVLVSKGVGIFDNILIYAKPNSSFPLIFQGNFLGLESVFTQTLSLVIKVNSRACIIGEIMKNDSSCFKCGQETYSLIDPMNEPIPFQKCNKCPTNSICLGGNKLYPSVGYFRISNASANMIPCKTTDACLGYIKNSSDVRGECAIGHFGTLCYYCKYAYGRESDNSICKLCSNNLGLLVFRLSLYWFIFLIYIFWNKKVIENYDHENDKYKTNINVLFQIFLNHYQQFMIIVLSRNLRFVLLPNILDIFSNISLSDSNIITNDCILQFLYKNSPIYLQFVKALIITLSPLIFSFLAFSLWFLVKILNLFCLKIRRKNYSYRELGYSNLISNFLIIFLITIFLLYPMIVKSCVFIFNCQSLDINDDRSYLINSPDFECWNADHFKAILFFSFPGLIIWGIGFPLILYYTLRKYHTIAKTMSQIKTSTFSKRSGRKSLISNRNSQELKKMYVLKYSEMFFFFDKDYKHKAQFWECFVFFRKFLLSFIMSLSDSIDFEASFVILIFMMFAYLNYTLSIKPYRSPRANSLEIISLVCLINVILVTEMRNITDSNYYLELLIFLIGFWFLFIFSFYVIMALILRIGKKIKSKKGRIRFLNEIEAIKQK